MFSRVMAVWGFMSVLWLILVLLVLGATAPAGIIPIGLGPPVILLLPILAGAGIGWLVRR